MVERLLDVLRLRVRPVLDLRERCDLVRPSELRCLFTVAAAICFARFVLRPRFFSPSLMCSYCRSSLLLHACGITKPPGAKDAEGIPLRELAVDGWPVGS